MVKNIKICFTPFRPLPKYKLLRDSHKAADIKGISRMFANIYREIKFACINYVHI